MSKFTYDISESSPDTGEASRSRYVFYFLENEKTFYLVEYYEESRQSKRHKWKINKCWKRDGLKSVDSDVEKLTEEQIPMDSVDRDEILEAFMDEFKVKKWSERKV